MGTPAPDKCPLNQLSLDELVELLPANDEERYLPRTSLEDEDAFKRTPQKFIKPEKKSVLDELWNRLFLKMEGSIRRKLWRLCPRQYSDREGFVNDALSDAYLAFLRRIKNRDARGQKYENFDGYVYEIFISVARDRVRRIVTDIEESDSSGPDELDVSHEETPEKQVAVAQLSRIIDEIFEKHAAENSLSMSTLVAHGREGKRWEDVADEVLPPSTFYASLEARKGRVRRLFIHDKALVAPDFERAGIKSEHVFHWKERSGVRTPKPETE